MGGKTRRGALKTGKINCNNVVIYLIISALIII